MTGKRTSTKTTFEPRERFVTLRFRSKDDYDPKDMERRGIDEDEYVTVLNMPLREMLTTALPELAGELLDYMFDHGKMRRADQGDVFYVGMDAWAFIKETDKKLFNGAQMHEVVTKATIPPLWIVGLEVDNAPEN